MSDGQSYIDRLASMATDKTAGCGDASCMFGRMGGLATNNGCTCLEGLPANAPRRRALQAAVALAHHVSKHGFTRQQIQEALQKGAESAPRRPRGKK